MVNGACAPCRAKKKRCIHRDLPAEAVEAVEAETDSTNMPAPISVSKGRPKAANKATEESEAVEDNPAQSTEVAGTETTENNTVQNNAKEVSLGPTGSDELSSVPSEVEKKPTKKRTKRARRSKVAVSQRRRNAPQLPSDPAEAACAMSVHTVFARELQSRIDKLGQDMQASRDAHRATMASAQAIQDTVDGWVEAWTSGR